MDDDLAYLVNKAATFKLLSVNGLKETSVGSILQAIASLDNI